MKILAVYNSKGGVGKTSTAVNLSHIIARHGLSTLVWDLDPQAAATFYFRVKAQVKGGSAGLFSRKNALDRAIRGTDYENLDLLPSDFSYRHFDRLLDASKRPAKRLQKLLKNKRLDYDLVVLDCPPTIATLGESILGVADVVLVPVIPTPLSMRTLAQVEALLKKGRVDRVRNRRLQVLPFFSMVDARKRLHRELCAEHLGRDFLHTRIPYASIVEQMGLQRAPVTSFAPNSGPALAYEDLWAEVRGYLK